MSVTPILDLEQDPPAPRSNRRAVLIWLVFGASIGIAFYSLGWALPENNWLLWIPFLYVAVAIHELAHLTVGQLAGMPPAGIVVGGFVAMRSGDHWTFRFEPRRILDGGMAIPLPSKDGFRIGRLSWMIAAGPLASIVCTFVCWSAFLKYGSGTWDWIGSMFWASAIGLGSLVPMSVGLNKSDAARLWSLWTQPDQSRSWMASVAVQAENVRGVRPRDWSPALVEQMMSEHVFPQLMAYLRCLDERNAPAACEHLERALAASARAGKAVRQSLFLEAAETSALVKAKSAQANVWRERALKLRKPESSSCTDGAIAMCEGRYGDALQDIVATRAFLLKRKLDSGLSRFAHERLDERERKCREALLVT